MLIGRRAAVAVALLIGFATSSMTTVPKVKADSGPVPPPTYQAGDYAQGNALSILPAGENGLVNAAQALAFEANGTRPPASDDQLAKYANLLYAPNNLDDSQLGNYYNDESFGVPPGDVTRVETPSSSVPVNIYRDTHDVPHIYSSTLAGAGFGIGYAQAEDRLFFMDVLRHYGQGTLSGFLGPSCTWERMDHDQLLTAPYTQAQAQAQLDAMPQEFGAKGQRLLDLLQAYSAGVNAFINAATTDPSLLPADYAAPAAPPAPWQPTDSIYVAAVIGGILGKGGGNEVGNAALLQYLQGHLGAVAGKAAFADFKEQNDPDAPTAITDRSFPYEIPGPVDPATTAIPDSASLTGGPTDTTPNCDLSPPSVPGLNAAQALLRLPHDLSNALVVDAAHSAGGHPIAVFGPQVGYFAPQVLALEDVHAPGYQAEGASIPGTGLVELGRGVDFAWSATSAGSDIVDQRLELVCNPNGGAPQPEGTSYLFNGQCLPMQKETFTEVGVPKAGGQGAPAVINHTIYLTRHGVVQGWTTAQGKPVAVVDQRSTFNHELDSGIGFLDWADPAVTHDATSWLAGASEIYYTFNWLYVDTRDIAEFTSGLDPIRPSNVDPNLPTWGTGNAEWQGWLPPDGHAHEINPPSGLLVSWNQKPAPGFSASDATYSYGPLYRSMTLVEELHHQLAVHGGKLTRANVVSAMQVGAAADFDGRELVPELASYLHGAALPPTDSAMLSQLESWAAGGALRRRAKHGDTQYADAAAVAIMDELEPRLIRAFFDPIFAAGGVGSYAGADDSYRVVPMEWVNTPNNDGGRLGSAYDDSGWAGHELRLLRELQHKPVGQPFSPGVSAAVCGPQGMNDCQTKVINALNDTYTAMVAANGGSTNVAAWTNDTATHTAGQGMPAFDDIGFQAVGLVGQPNIDWQNRPTFQQVVMFPTGRVAALTAAAPRAPAPAAVGHLATTGPPRDAASTGMLLVLAAAALLAFRRRARL
ncbi:MAG: penicillin acylase family protein [Acidimicrobiia bacterium]|nr:penicillin acylase family protein [Acidimicrobiia bacterium]